MTPERERQIADIQNAIGMKCADPMWGYAEVNRQLLRSAAKAIKDLREENETLRTRLEVDAELAACRLRIAELEAKVDALMLEYRPDEMTPEQIENWGRHQRAVDPALDAAINAALNSKKESNT